MSIKNQIRIDPYKQTRQKCVVKSEIEIGLYLDVYAKGMCEKLSKAEFATPQDYFAIVKIEQDALDSYSLPQAVVEDDEKAIILMVKESKRTIPHTSWIILLPALDLAYSCQNVSHMTTFFSAEGMDSTSIWSKLNEK